MTTNRSWLAALLAHHADVIAANLRKDPHRDCWIAAEKLDEHANALTADAETPAVAELLDSILTFEAEQAAAQAPAGTDLRDRIAKALADADGWVWTDGPKERSSMWKSYQHRADAVLAVLPAPADRAALDRVRRLADRYQQWHEGGWTPRDASLVAREFRAAAAEEQRAEAEPLVQVGWWCWRCNGLVADACRSDNVPIHVPAQWANDMRELNQRRTGGDDTAAAEDSASTLTQLADADPEYREVLLKRGEELYANGVCPYSETDAPGSGCILPAGHKPENPHIVTPGDTDEEA